MAESSVLDAVNCNTIGLAPFRCGERKAVLAVGDPVELEARSIMHSFGAQHQKEGCPVGSMIACSNSMGMVAVASQQGVNIYKCAAIDQTLSSVPMNEEGDAAVGTLLTDPSLHAQLSFDASGRTFGLYISGPGTRLAVLREDQIYVFALDGTSLDAVCKIPTAAAQVLECAWHPSEQSVFAVLTSDGTVALYSIPTPAVLQSTSVDGGTVIAWSADGTHLLVGLNNGTISCFAYDSAKHTFKNTTDANLLSLCAIVQKPEPAVASMACHMIFPISDSEVMVGWRSTDADDTADINGTFISIYYLSGSSWTCDMLGSVAAIPFDVDNLDVTRHRYFVQYLRQWDVLVVGSSMSTDVKLLCRGKSVFVPTGAKGEQVPDAVTGPQSSRFVVTQAVDDYYGTPLIECKHEGQEGGALCYGLALCTTSTQSWPPVALKLTTAKDVPPLPQVLMYGSVGLAGGAWCLPLQPSVFPPFNPDAIVDVTSNSATSKAPVAVPTINTKPAAVAAFGNVAHQQVPAASSVGGFGSLSTANKQANPSTPAAAFGVKTFGSAFPSANAAPVTPFASTPIKTNPFGVATKVAPVVTASQPAFEQKEAARPDAEATQTAAPSAPAATTTGPANQAEAGTPAAEGTVSRVSSLFAAAQTPVPKLPPLISTPQAQPQARQAPISTGPALISSPVAAAMDSPALKSVVNRTDPIAQNFQNILKNVDAAISTLADDSFLSADEQRRLEGNIQAVSTSVSGLSSLARTVRVNITERLNSANTMVHTLQSHVSVLVGRAKGDAMLYRTVLQQATANGGDVALNVQRALQDRPLDPYLEQSGAAATRKLADMRKCASAVARRLDDMQRWHQQTNTYGNPARLAARLTAEMHQATTQAAHLRARLHRTVSRVQELRREFGLPVQTDGSRRGLGRTIEETGATPSRISLRSLYNSPADVDKWFARLHTSSQSQLRTPLKPVETKHDAPSATPVTLQNRAQLAAVDASVVVPWVNAVVSKDKGAVSQLLRAAWGSDSVKEVVFSRVDTLASRTKAHNTSELASSAATKVRSSVLDFTLPEEESIIPKVSQMDPPLSAPPTQQLPPPQPLPTADRSALNPTKAVEKPVVIPVSQSLKKLTELPPSQQVELPQAPPPSLIPKPSTTASFAMRKEPSQTSSAFGKSAEPKPEASVADAAVSKAQAKAAETAPENTPPAPAEAKKAAIDSNVAVATPVATSSVSTGEPTPPESKVIASKAIFGQPSTNAKTTSVAAPPSAAQKPATSTTGAAADPVKAAQQPPVDPAAQQHIDALLRFYQVYKPAKATPETVAELWQKYGERVWAALKGKSEYQSVDFSEFTAGLPMIEAPAENPAPVQPSFKAPAPVESSFKAPAALATNTTTATDAVTLHKQALMRFYQDINPDKATPDEINKLWDKYGGSIWDALAKKPGYQEVDFSQYTSGLPPVPAAAAPAVNAATSKPATSSLPFGATAATKGFAPATAPAAPFAATPFGKPALSSSAPTTTPAAPFDASPFGSGGSTASPFGGASTASPFGQGSVKSTPFGKPADSKPAFGVKAANKSAFPLASGAQSASALSFSSSGAPSFAPART